MKQPLAAQITGAAVVVAIVVSAAFVITIATTLDLRRSTALEGHSKDVVASTLEAQSLVVDLETGVRGYVLSRNPQFLQPWRTAQRSWPKTIERLEHLVAGDTVEENRAQTVAYLVNAYETDYAYPVIFIAKIAPTQAVARIASAEARRRVDAIRTQLRRILSVEATRSAHRAARARVLERHAVEAAVVGLAASALLVLLFGAWIARSVARPIRTVTESAAAVTAGDFGTRMDERGAGEIGTLKQAFNAMTRALEAGRLELLEQNERLRVSEHAKGDLISMISHELRTPLSSVLGFTTLLLQRDFPPEERQRYLEIIDTEARRLAELASDFLDVRLLEEGRLVLELRPVNLGQLVRRQAHLFFAHRETHQLALDVPPEPLIVAADADRVAQVMANLLSNAIKYSPDGGIVSISVLQTGSSVRVAVTDEGIGIGRQDQERIFEKFFRGGAPAAGIPGTGLGLAVARMIVEGHDGTIGFTSLADEGTTFWFELPLSDQRPRRPASANPPAVVSSTGRPSPS